jgi:hypothetical protein
MKRKVLLFLGFNFLMVSLFAQSTIEVKIPGANGNFINTDELIRHNLRTSKPTEKVVSFKVTTVIEGKSKTFNSNSNKCPEDFIPVLQNISSGNTISFDSIVVKKSAKEKEKQEFVVVPTLKYVVKREYPQVSIGKFLNYSELSISELLSDPFLTCSNGDIKISSFSMLINLNENVQQFVTTSDQFSNEIKSAISKLKGGEVVWFENIKAIKDSALISLLPFKISILASNDNFPCSISGISIGEWDKTKLATSTELKVPSKEVSIESFMMTVSVNGEYKYFRQTEGAKLTSEMVDFLKLAQPGTIIRIDQIRANRLGVGMKLNPIILRIAGESKLKKAVIGNLSIGEQTFDYIKSNGKITANGVTANYFVVRTISDNLFTSSNGTFTAAQLDQLAQLPKGTVLQFYNIHIEEAGKRVKTDDIWFKIK